MRHQIAGSQASELIPAKTMPPPSALAIKTSSVVRLVKEEASYHKEATQQRSRVEKLEAEGADEYELRQQVRFNLLIYPHRSHRLLSFALVFEGVNTF